jgi:hypothetical protein
VLFAGLAVLLVGYLAGTSPAGATASSETSRTVKVSEAGISLTYPSDWRVLPANPKQLKAQLKNLASDPELLATARDYIKSGTYRYIKLRAVGAASGSPEGLLVQVGPGVADHGLDSFIDVANQAFEQVGGTAENSGVVAPVDGKIAYRFDGRIPFTTATGTVDKFAGVLMIPSRHGKFVVIEVVGDDTEAGRKKVDDVLTSVHLS